MKTTIIALALVIGGVSAAAAQEADPNLLNRYPVYNMTVTGAAPTLTTRDVALSGGHVAKSGEQLWLDRASFSTGQ